MPVKFDDLSKVATAVLDDDHHTKGWQLKAKQQARYSGPTLSTQVDLFSDKAVATPAKLTWKWPTPFGIGGALVDIDKLEVDKGGKFKLEASSGGVRPGLKLELKSDLVDLDKIVAGFTYTGVKNAQVKAEFKALHPEDFTAEVTYAHDLATVGMKLNKSILNGGAPDLGVRILRGPFFCSLLTKDKFKGLNASVFYKVTDDVKCAATLCPACPKCPTKYTVGLSYKGMAKVKVDQDQTVSLSVKHAFSKGFTLLGGTSYGLKNGTATSGLQLSVE